MNLLKHLGYTLLGLFLFSIVIAFATGLSWVLSYHGKWFAAGVGIAALVFIFHFWGRSIVEGTRKK